LLSPATCTGCWAMTTETALDVSHTACPVAKRSPSVIQDESGLGRTSQRGQTGFTWFELVVAMWITAVLAAVSLPYCVRAAGTLHVFHTAQRLIWELRYAQTAAQVTGQGSVVRLFPYSPQYWTYVRGNVVDASMFDPGVMYRDGYLQLGSGAISYDVQGTSTVAGTVALVSGPDEQDIHLYMGSGLQVLGDGP
jgi:type II secretory pathway pseudopilin PulG